MPGILRFFANSLSERSIASVVDPSNKHGKNTVESDIHSGPSTTFPKIGTLAIEKNWATGSDGKPRGYFTYTANFNKDSGFPSSEDGNSLAFEGNHTHGSGLDIPTPTPPNPANPTEIIPQSKDSVLLELGILDKHSAGKFLSQGGYVEKTKSRNTPMREYIVNFVTKIVVDTDAFGGVPTKNRAPLS